VGVNIDLVVRDMTAIIILNMAITDRHHRYSSTLISIVVMFIVVLLIWPSLIVLAVLPIIIILLILLHSTRVKTAKSIKAVTFIATRRIKYDKNIIALQDTYNGQKFISITATNDCGGGGSNFVVRSRF